MIKDVQTKLKKHIWKCLQVLHQKNMAKSLVTFSKRLFREYQFFNLNLSSVILYRLKHERYKIINKDIKIVKMQKINSKKYKQLSFHS